MNEIEKNNVLKNLLGVFDTSTQKISEAEIFDVLNEFIKEKYSENRLSVPECLKAEKMAFGFIEDCKNSETGWGTYHGPCMTFNDKERGYIEFPSIKEITPSMIEYWEKRADESKNPILKARYADLAWDFSEKIKGAKPDYKMAIKVIESNIEIADKDLHKYPQSVIVKLKRALSLALALNNRELVEKVKETIINYEKKIGKDNDIGLWGFSFDLLLKNEKVVLTEGEKEEIIKDLEERLDRISKSPEHDFWAAENASLRLANYYSGINKKNDVKRVLLKYGQVVKEALSKGPSALVTISWLERLFHIYMQYNMKDEADEISIEIRKFGEKADSEFVKIEVPVSIPTKEVEIFINNLIDGDLKTALERITVYYVPKKEEAIKQLEDLSKKVPIQFLFTRKIQDSSGRVTATVGPLSEDFEGHVVLQIAQNMSLSSMFLRDTIKALISKFNPDAKSIIDYMYQSPIFGEDRRLLIEKSIEEYLNGEYVIALHVLIPQVEALIRNLEEKTGGSVFRQSRYGGFNYKTFEEMLWDENISRVLGEDLTSYFRVLFVDSRGWNLRNNICHGISTSESLNATSADRVFHSLLCLSLIREQEEDNAR